MGDGRDGGGRCPTTPHSARTTPFQGLAEDGDGHVSMKTHESRVCSAAGRQLALCVDTAYLGMGLPAAMRYH